MSRAKNGPAAKARHKKVLKLAKGFRGGQSKLFRTAQEKVNRALRFAYRDRRVKKRDFRGLWIMRIGIAAREHGMSYSQFMFGLKQANIALNRKSLAELAALDAGAFAQVAEAAKKALLQVQEQKAA